MASFDYFTSPYNTNRKRYEKRTQRKRKLEEVSGYVHDKRYHEYYDEEPPMKLSFRKSRVCFHPGIKRYSRKNRRRKIRKPRNSLKIGWNSQEIFLS